MSPDAQRIALAKARGFADIRMEEMEQVDIESRSIYTWTELRGALDGKRQSVPDYLNNLNTIHEAEEASSVFKAWERTEEWMNNLELVVIGRRAESRPDFSFILRATAAQRAEALLRTLGLWDDGL